MTTAGDIIVLIWARRSASSVAGRREVNCATRSPAPMRVSNRVASRCLMRAASAIGCARRSASGHSKPGLGDHPGGHGAAFAAIKGGKLAFAPLDYEQEIPVQTLCDYRAQRDDFAQTGSPALPRGLNIGAQLHWLESAVERRHPPPLGAILELVPFRRCDQRSDEPGLPQRPVESRRRRFFRNGQTPGLGRALRAARQGRRRHRHAETRIRAGRECQCPHRHSR